MDIMSTNVDMFHLSMVLFCQPLFFNPVILYAATGMLSFNHLYQSINQSSFVLTHAKKLQL